MKLLAAVCLLLALSVPLAGAAANPSVTLKYPEDAVILTSPNLTLSCSATDDENIYSVSLYHDMNGSFSLNDTNRSMGFQYDSSSLLFCQFDGSYECIDGETGTNSGTLFEDSWMGKGVIVQGEDFLYYPLSGNMDYDQGTIEMWLKVGFDPNDDAYILSTGTGTNNRIKIYTEYGSTDLIMGFYDDYGSEGRAIVSIASWAIGEWHHIAAVWDVNDLVGSGRINDLFIDGSNQSASYEGNFYSKGTSLGSSLYIGSNAIPSMESNSVIDELSVSSVVLPAEDINISYQRLTTNHSGEDFNWSFSYVADGTYVWNCMAYDNESNSSWGAANYTFSVDAVTPPTINSITFDAESSGEIDPGIALNVTVNASDVSNVSSVTLMYKSPYAGLYTNDSMDYNEGTGLWENGTIVTDADEGNWSYRIFSNDTWGHAGLSSVYTVDVSKERSWALALRNSTGDAADGFGEVTGFGSTEKNMGILVINNTGDYVANFDLDAYYIGSPLTTAEVSYNVSEPFDLQPKGTACVNVNVTVPETENEYVLGINISTTSIPTEYSVNGTVISSIGGPYINRTVEITSAPLTVPQSSVANFTAKIKNIGNETAENVTLNWSFTPGWTVSYGNQSHFTGNVSPYETVYVTVTLSAGSGAAAGTAFVWVNASDAQGSTAGNDMAALFVTCTSGDGACGSGCTSANDDDCEQPAGGGTTDEDAGIGILGIAGEPSISVSLPSRVDLDRGQQAMLAVNVTSTGGIGTNVTGVGLEISGYDAALIGVVPKEIGYIEPDETGSFEVLVDVPSYVEEREYLVTFKVTAVGTYRGRSVDMEVSRSTIFAVHAVLQNDTLSAIESAEEALADMQSAGLSTGKIEDMLEEAKRDYENMDYGSARDATEEIISLKRTAFGLLSSFEELDGDMAEAESYGLGIDETKRMDELAKSAFQRGDYSRAEERLGAALNAFQLETKNVIDIIRFVRSYWYVLLTVIAAVLLIGVFGRRRLRIRVAEGRLESMRKSEAAVRDMIRELQKDYYERRAISKMDYQATKENYEKRLARLVAEQVRQKRKLSMMKSGGGRKSLEVSRKLVTEMMRKLQSDYFDKGLMGKDAYKAALAELEGELDQIERDMEIEGRKKRKGLAYIVLVMVLAFAFYSSFSGVSFSGNVVSVAGNVTDMDVQQAISEAETVIGEMQSLGFQTGRPNATLENAMVALGRGEYELALTTARYVKVIKQKAVLVYDLLDQVEVRIQEVSSQGLDTTSSREMFTKALGLFESEGYEEAEETLTVIMDQLDEEEQKAALERAAKADVLGNVYTYVVDNSSWLAAAVAVVLLASVPATVKLRKMRRKSRKKKLKEAVESMKGSMKRLQDEYFNKGAIGKASYASRMERHKRELSGMLESLTAEASEGE